MSKRARTEISHLHVIPLLNGPTLLQKLPLAIVGVICSFLPLGSYYSLVQCSRSILNAAIHSRPDCPPLGEYTLHVASGRWNVERLAAVLARLQTLRIRRLRISVNQATKEYVPALVLAWTNQRGLLRLQIWSDILFPCDYAQRCLPSILSGLRECILVADTKSCDFSHFTGLQILSVGTLAQRLPASLTSYTCNAEYYGDRSTHHTAIMNIGEARGLQTLVLGRSILGAEILKNLQLQCVELTKLKCWSVTDLSPLLNFRKLNSYTQRTSSKSITKRDSNLDQLGSLQRLSTLQSLSLSGETGQTLLCDLLPTFTSLTRLRVTCNSDTDEPYPWRQLITGASRLVVLSVRHVGLSELALVSATPFTSLTALKCDYSDWFGTHLSYGAFRGHAFGSMPILPSLCRLTLTQRWRRGAPLVWADPRHQKSLLQRLHRHYPKLEYLKAPLWDPSVANFSCLHTLDIYPECVGYVDPEQAKRSQYAWGNTLSASVSFEAHHLWSFLTAAKSLRHFRGGARMDTFRQQAWDDHHICIN
jgi:hypothetical protein